jgi:hypothetical protein
MAHPLLLTNTQTLVLLNLFLKSSWEKVPLISPPLAGGVRGGGKKGGDESLWCEF